jgi:type VI secretion system protein ImpA
MDFSALLMPISADLPSGENLEYDPAFIELELAAQHGEERQVGDQIQKGEDPDYPEVAKLSHAILQRSHDIRAAVFLAEAVLNTKGLVVFAEVLGYIRGILQDHWSSAHPELDEDDGDATMRINAVQGLANPDGVLRALRRVPLTDSRIFGKMSLRHIEVAEGNATPSADMENVPDATALAAAFQDSDQGRLQAIAAAVTTAIADVRAIDAVFVEHTPGEGPQLDRLSTSLRSISRALTQYADAGAAADAGATDAAAADSAPPVGGAAFAAAVPGAATGGAINTSDDVIRMLDRITAYYARCEPSSPVPILLARAKRLVNADFLTIIADMAHDGLDEVHRIGGIKDDD